MSELLSLFGYEWFIFHIRNAKLAADFLMKFETVVVTLLSIFPKWSNLISRHVVISLRRNNGYPIVIPNIIMNICKQCERNNYPMSIYIYTHYISNKTIFLVSFLTFWICSSVQATQAYNDEINHDTKLWKGNNCYLPYFKYNTFVHKHTSFILLKLYLFTCSPFPSVALQQQMQRRGGWGNRGE
jgi:hypothetical protein